MENGKGQNNMKKNVRSSTTPVSPLCFFAFTFILSWLVWIPLALSHFGIAFHIPESTSAVVRLLGALMPAVAALLLSTFSSEKGAARQVLGRLGRWRVGWKWWGAAGLVYPLLLVLSALICNWLGWGRVLFVAQAPGALIVNIIFLLIAVLGEEIGWHGVALPALQQKRSALVSSLILAACWGAWHLPFWLLLDTFDQFGLLYPALNLLFIFPTTFFITWVFNHSQYSLLLPVVFHLVFNIINTALLPVTLNLAAFAILIVLGWILALVVMPHLEGNRILLNHN
jgi:membrane protease YdiL (CAAX protease family)